MTRTEAIEIIQTEKDRYQKELDRLELYKAGNVLDEAYRGNLRSRINELSFSISKIKLIDSLD